RSWRFKSSPRHTRNKPPGDRGFVHSPPPRHASILRREATPAPGYDGTGPPPCPTEPRPMAFDLDARLAEWRKSLLDTTKRNRLIKFVAGRLGGVNIVHPPAADLWGRLVRDGGTLSFPWKRELLGLSPELL